MLDDLPQLRELWRKAGFPMGDVERRFTEFQVAVEAEEEIVGAMAIQISQHQGLVQWEVYRATPAPPTLRTPLWERVLKVAGNNGVWILWSRDGLDERAALGFAPATEDLLKKLPPMFAKPGATWLALKLKEETPPPSLDAEFNLFVAAQKAETERTMKQGKGLRVLAYVLLTVVVGLLFYGGMRLVQEVAAREGWGISNSSAW